MNATQLIRILILGLLLQIPCKTDAQLEVDTVPDVQSLLEEFFGPSMIQISNVETKGATDYYGTFNGENTNLGLESGLIMCNGDIDLAIGPNDLLEVGIFDDTGLIGDDDFDVLTGLETEDASIIEFDFIAASDSILIHYIWASEEYPEWVANLIYNDAMAIWLDGENIALLPDGQYVCVNNVNCFGLNSELYWCNDPMNPDLVPCPNTFDCPQTIEETTLQYDGLTIPLLAEMVLNPGQTYHLKMGLIDASDNGADSGVFFSADWTEPVITDLSTIKPKRFNISPNPIEDHFSITLSKNGKGIVELCDLSGRLIESWEYQKGETYLLNSNMPVGSYVLSVFFEGQAMQSALLIKK